MDVEPSDTVASVMDNIYNELGLPPDNQCLMYGLKLLEDEHTLSHYNVEGTIRLSIKPPKSKMDIIMVGGGV